MHVLIVEDDPEVAAFITQRVEQFAPHYTVICIDNLSSAEQQIAEVDDLELVVCDLRIPSAPGSLDTDDAHGRAVQARLALDRPGVPTIFLSAYAGDHVTDLGAVAAYGGSFDLGNGQSIRIVSIAEKRDLGQFRELLEEIIDGCTLVDSTPLHGASDLSVAHQRLIRLAIRRQQLFQGRVSLIHGGVSGASTYRVDAANAAGVTAASLFLKIGDPRDVEDEIRGYKAFVPGRLGAGNYASLVDEICHLSCGVAAAAFKFADNVEGSFFDALTGDAPVGVEELSTALSPWHAVRERDNFAVAELRRQRVQDGVLRETGLLADANVADLEAATLVDVPTSVNHGDLHGDNVLIAGGRPSLIDFRDTKHGLAVMDPLTLELSLWTHVKGRQAAAGWPDVRAADRWWDLPAYLDGCPFSELVRSCREWAMTLADGDERLLCVAAYLHSVRQLKYQDVDSELALAFARSAAARWASLS